MQNNNNLKSTNAIPSLVITTPHPGQIISSDDSHHQTLTDLVDENTNLHSSSNNSAVHSNHQKITNLSKFKNEQKKILLAPGYYNLNFANRLPQSENLPRISMSEVQKHNKEDDAWTVFRGLVYNITPFMKLHPGGKIQLMRAAGTDCTQLFDTVHPWVNGHIILAPNLIGICK